MKTKEIGNKIICLLLLSVLLVGTLFVSSCGKNKDDGKVIYDVYYLDSDYSSLVPGKYEGTADTDMYELLSVLSIVTDNHSARGIGELGVSTVGIEVVDGVATVSFSGGYESLDVAGQTLVKAAVVKTLTQLDEVSGVKFMLGEFPLTDHLGAEVPVMTADSFVSNPGLVVSDENSLQFVLYFADAEENYLRSISREVSKNTDASREQIVIEELIAGPTTGNFRKVMPEGTKVNSVSVADGLCYVDLSNEFLTGSSPVGMNLTVYSMVNSLAELNSVRKVQILIDGNVTEITRDGVDLSQVFSRNLDIVGE
ncbi:MAG: GerMN domain-containing protein [Lachnospiraceae bacterium]|nr:GerMN domain-containing protein [Lachnospiraceae bacterium]